MSLRQETETIIQEVLSAARPEKSVREAVAALPPCAAGSRTFLLAVGKAAGSMAVAALNTPGFDVHQAMIVTKYGHVGQNAINALPADVRRRLVIHEAGHPIPDENSYIAADKAIAMVSKLTACDRVILLLSGGGSALFEKPLLPPSEVEDISRQLLASGAGIGEINVIRKRLSAVKGGRFAQRCAPARVFTIALSDVLGDAPDQIASGPACPDPSTCMDAQRIAGHYDLQLSPAAQQLLRQETPKELPNATVRIIGSMIIARNAAARACKAMGYPVRVFVPPLTCHAQQAGRFLGALARKAHREGRKLAIVAGGETVVSLPEEHGLGGRNQEAALAASLVLQGCDHLCFFSLGTDGTDGPSDAAGGWVDGETVKRLRAAGGPAVSASLRLHDAYHALEKTKGLIFTGPTGTNVNDICVALVHPQHKQEPLAIHGKNNQNPVSKIDKQRNQCYYANINARRRR